MKTIEEEREQLRYEQRIKYLRDRVSRETKQFLEQLKQKENVK